MANDVTENSAALSWERSAPGVWTTCFAEPEAQTPLRHLLRANQSKNANDVRPEPPAVLDGVACHAGPRGVLVRLPCAVDEDFYGLGLQFHSLRQTGRKKTLRVNSDPSCDLGDSHAPVPFFVSTAGYGIHFDTARKASFYFGRQEQDPNAGSGSLNDSEETLYSLRAEGARHVEVEIPLARGITLTIFEGPTVLDAVARYNRFSGGGCLPPLWGLGVWYRGHLEWSHEEASAMLEQFRASGIPCDVIGLEPGWQTAAYSCSYRWNPARFPNPGAFIAGMADRNAHINLWEHGFVHPTSPVHENLLALSADTRVWGGLVPDFTIPRARECFARFHAGEHIGIGVSGYKLDECDGSDFTPSPWSFPDHAQFPGGCDGEQMHALFGSLYQDVLEQPFVERNTRTFGLVRSSHSFSAPRPYVLYSDYYDHRAYVRALASSGFCGLLWTPEVREASSRGDLLRRLQTVVFSPLAGINAWYIPNPPWLQLDRKKNQRGEIDPAASEIEHACREILRLRMRFLPYFYAAFARYHFDGIPPFRAVVMDYPDDPQTRAIDDCYLVGDSFLVAPLFQDDTSRCVYLPQGTWHDFWTGDGLEGGREHTITSPQEQLPLFVKSGSLLPLAAPVEYVSDSLVFKLEPRRYGNPVQPTRLFVDDGLTFDYRRGRFAWQDLTWDKTNDVFQLSETPAGFAPRYALRNHSLPLWT